MLAHELSHAYQDSCGKFTPGAPASGEIEAMIRENGVRYGLYQLDPKSENQYPRPGYVRTHPDCGATVEEAWSNYTHGPGDYPVYP